MMPCFFCFFLGGGCVWGGDDSSVSAWKEMDSSTMLMSQMSLLWGACQPSPVRMERGKA